MAVDKTKWAAVSIKFLGVVIDGLRRVLTIPEDKRCKAVNLIRLLISKKKCTVAQIQSLTGLLNFINRTIHPGRAFTQCMYAKFSGKTKGLKKYHHVAVDAELRSDCTVWLSFLESPDIATKFCRPLIDFSDNRQAVRLQFYMDSSGNPELGFGGWFRDEYFFHQWEPGYVKKYRPSITYLELYAVCMVLFIWEDRLADSWVIIHCDNKPVCDMIDDTTAGCANCMKLIRMLVLHGLKFNTRVFTDHVRMHLNGLADHLSRLKIKKFFEEEHESMHSTPQPLHPELWPASKIW